MSSLGGRPTGENKTPGGVVNGDEESDSKGGGIMLDDGPGLILGGGSNAGGGAEPTCAEDRPTAKRMTATVTMNRATKQTTLDDLADIFALTQLAQDMHAAGREVLREVGGGGQCVLSANTACQEHFGEKCRTPSHPPFRALFRDRQRFQKLKECARSAQETTARRICFPRQMGLAIVRNASHGSDA